MTPIGWYTYYRCGCSLITRDHGHPAYCPYHAPGLTEWGDGTLAARTGQVEHTSPIHTEPIAWGLLVERLEAVS